MEKQKIQKTQMRIFKNMGRNIPGGNFPGGSFPDTIIFVKRVQ